MRYRRFPSLILTAISAAFASIPARAQCREWQPGFNLPGVGGNVNAFAVFDDGTGPALFVGGSFDTAGGIAARGIAKWDGSTWSALGTGLGAHAYSPQVDVHDLAVFDDGSGPELYVTGWFATAGGIGVAGLARWNGTSWSDVGNAFQSQSYPYPQAMAVYDDGSGPDLYVGGDFHVPGNPNSWGIARWDGTSWSSLGIGLGGSPPQVFDMAVFDDGSGPALFVGGTFDSAGSVPVHHLAKWDGSIWSSLGSDVDSQVGALTVYDDGSGAALYVGGSFGTAGGVSAHGIARWDGTLWSALAVDPGVGIGSLAVFDDGSGSALYAGGGFTESGAVSANGIARWDGSTWSALGLGLDRTGVGAGLAGTATALAIFDDGSGPALFAGGGFDWAGGLTANHIARWRSSTWSPIGPGNGLRGSADVLTFFDDGSGPLLYTAQGFNLPGGVYRRDVLQWDGASWSHLPGQLVGGVAAMTVHDDGSGPSLYVGGSISSVGGLRVNNIARWDGYTWSALGSGVESPGGSYVEVKSLKSFDDGSGPALYAGGYFTQAGGVAASHVARWDGTSWSPLGLGLDGTVTALEVFDDGTGPALFAGGYFNFSGSSSVAHVAKWNGANWSSPGGGVNNTVYSLATVDLGSGPSLYAGGTFVFAGGIPAKYVARWNGSAWSALGRGPEQPSVSLIGFDDGAGPALYSGGGFSSSSYSGTRGISTWGSTGWTTLGGGMSGGEGDFHAVRALAVGDLDADGVQDLYLGGNFGRAGSVGSNGIAEWRGCAHSGTPTCFGDGGGAACPCGNSGSPGHGCNNSSNSGGARLEGTGVPSLASDSFVLTSSGERPNVLSIFFQGDQQVAPAFDGDGLRCTGGNVKRLYSHSAFGTIATAPLSTEPPVSARSAALGDPLSAGATRMYQVYYRDRILSFCPDPPGNAFNLSSALSIQWVP